jgi:two-component system, NarL family, sensor histidine kinase LiaS
MWFRRNLLARLRRYLPDFVPPDEETRHERLRIARDLHDTVAQRLAALGFALDATIADEIIPADRKRDLRAMRVEVSAIVQGLRDEILALRDDESSSIESWLRERLEIEITWHRVAQAIFPFSLSLPSNREQDLKYLLLELIRNAISHRGLVKSSIAEATDSLEVKFLEFVSASSRAPQASDESRSSFGRVGILERTHRLGMTLDEWDEGFALRW